MIETIVSVVALMVVSYPFIFNGYKVVKGNIEDYLLFKAYLEKNRNE